MEYIQKILPFLFILVVIISRSRNRIPQNTRTHRTPPIYPSNEKQITENETNNTLNDHSNMEYLDIESIPYTDNEDILEGYIRQQRETFDTIINTPGIIVNESSEDFIGRSEIGKTNKFLSRDTILNGIIMSEVLGKPKFLKK